VIQLSLIESLRLGKTLITSLLLVCINILEPQLSKISKLSVPTNSQDLALKAYGLEVNAPTGQRSMIFPESSDFSISLL